MANVFKKIGKKLKKLGQKIGKVVGKVAPIAAFIPGVGTAIAGVAGAASKFLGKGGQYAAGYADKLNKVQGILATGQTGGPGPTAPEAYAQPAEQPQPVYAGGSPSFNEGQQYGPAAPAGYGEPRSGGIDMKWVLIGGGALVAILLLTRRK